MKSTLLLGLFLFPFYCFSQKHFTIQGNGSGLKDGDKIFLQYKIDKGVVNDSVVVANGTFNFKGKIKGIVRASLYRNQNPKYSDEMYDFVHVYLEQGNIKLTSKDTLLNSEVTGTPSNEDNSELKVLLHPFLEKSKLLNDPLTLTAEDKKDTALVVKAKMDWYNYTNSMVPIKLKFAKTHPSSFVSLVTLSEIIKDSYWLDEVQLAYAALDPELMSSALGNSLMTKIQLGRNVTRRSCK